MAPFTLSRRFSNRCSCLRRRWVGYDSCAADYPAPYQSVLLLKMISVFLRQRKNNQEQKNDFK